MFYKIDDKYYVLVGSKYTEVRFEKDKDNIHAIPTSNIIEKTPQIKAIEKSFDEVKKDFKTQKSFDEKPVGGKRYKYSRFDG